MANKPVKKYPINKDIFMSILKDKNLSIRKLGAMKEFDYTDKSIGRALKIGYMSENLAISLSKELNVPISDFS